MYRLVIADDEKAIRETIASFIDWKSLDIDVVAVCKNGNEAYDAILDEYPDIVLTDIHMPGMSGLEMIQRLKEVGGEIEFIILSGYGEFEYAKKAMELGVDHYLLKPCNENEIIKVIEAAKETCRKRQHIQELSRQQYIARSDVFSSRVWTILENALSAGECDNPFASFSDFLEQHRENFSLFHYAAAEDSFPVLTAALVDTGREKFPDRALCCLRTQHILYLLCEASAKEMQHFQVSGSTAEEPFTTQGLGDMLTHILAQIKCHGQFSVLVHDVPLPLKGAPATPMAEKLIGTMKDSISGAASSNKIVDKTIQYMEEHLSDPDVSLKNIAETYLFMNVDYVSKQFVKYTGKRFSAYLNELKIERAKQLLTADPEIKISTVADAVGCANNPQYFNYIFKKQTGMTPSNYQQNCRNARNT